MKRRNGYTGYKSTIRRIVSAMSDGVERSSYDIAVLLYGSEYTPAQWWNVAGALELIALVSRPEIGVTAPKFNSVLSVRHNGSCWLYRAKQVSLV